MTLQSRLLGVFAQYPDPRVGYEVSEIVTGRTYGIYGLRRARFELTIAREFAGHGQGELSAQNRLGVDAPALTHPLLSDDLFFALPRTKVDRWFTQDFLRAQAHMSSRLAHGLHSDSLDAKWTAARLALNWFHERERKLPTLLDDNDMAVVCMFWLGMLHSGLHFSADITRNTPREALIPWLARIVASAFRDYRKGMKLIILTTHLAVIENGFPAVADWAVATRPNLMSYSWAQAANESLAWHDRIAAEAEAAEKIEAAAPPIPGSVIYTFPDGHTLQQLVTKEQLVAEGRHMRHCVGQYWREVEQGLQTGLGTRIYSLRAPDGTSLVTFEVSCLWRAGCAIRQAKMINNTKPSESWLCRMIKEIVVQMGWSMTETQDLAGCREAMRFGY